MEEQNATAEAEANKGQAKISIKAESIASKDHPDRNEDSHFFNEESQSFGVFDGVGGHAKGEVASQLAKDEVEQSFGQSLKAGMSLEDAEKAVSDALVAANKKVYEESNTDASKKGMASTGVAGFVWEGSGGERKLVVGSCGDSRVYLLREGKLEQVSIDDNNVAIEARTKGWDEAQLRQVQAKLNNALSLNELTSDEQALYQHRNRIFNNLGERSVSPKVSTIDLQPGDRILISSDGVHDNLTDGNPNDPDSIQKILSESPDGDAAAKKLTEVSNARSKDGNHPRSKSDDITAVVIEIPKPEPVAAVAPEPAPVVPEPVAATTEKKRSRLGKVLTSVGKPFEVTPQPGYPADMPPGLYLKWNKDHYEMTEADKRILENRKLAAEGKAPLRSEKPENWWNEHQYIKWLDGNYVPTKEDLVRKYNSDPEGLGAKEKKLVEKWIKEGYKLPTEEVPAVAPQPEVQPGVQPEAVEPTKPITNKVELRKGFAQENWDGMFGENGDVTKELDKGESVYIEMTDPWIGELTKRSFEERPVDSDGVQVKVFRAGVIPRDEIQPRLKKEARPGAIELAVNATARRERHIFGLKIGGLERGLSGQMTLVNSPHKEGEVTIGVRTEGDKAIPEITTNPENVLGREMNNFLYANLSEGLNERYVRSLQNKLGDKAKDLKLTIITDPNTGETKLRIDFVAKPKEATGPAATTETVAPPVTPGVPELVPEPEPAPTAGGPEASESEIKVGESEEVPTPVIEESALEERVSAPEVAEPDWANDFRKGMVGHEVVVLTDSEGNSNRLLVWWDKGRKVYSGFVDQKGVPIAKELSPLRVKGDMKVEEAVDELVNPFGEKYTLQRGLYFSRDKEGNLFLVEPEVVAAPKEEASISDQLESTVTTEAGEKPLAKLTPDEFMNLHRESLQKLSESKDIYGKNQSEENRTALTESIDAYYKVLQEQRRRLDASIDSARASIEASDLYKEFSDLETALNATIDKFDAATTPEDRLKEMEHVQGMLVMRERRARKIKDALSKPETVPGVAVPEAGKREVVSPAEFRNELHPDGVDFYQITSSFRAATGDKPAETHFFTYWIKDGKLYRAETDLKGNPIKEAEYPPKEYGEGFDEAKAREEIKKELKQAAEPNEQRPGATVAYIKLYKEQSAQAETKTKEVAPVGEAHPEPGGAGGLPGEAPKTELTNEQLNTPIEDIDLSVRVFNSLKRQGITTVGEVLELLEKGDEAVMSVRNFGEASVSELRQKVRDKGFLPGEEKPEASSELPLAETQSVEATVATPTEEGGKSEEESLGQKVDKIDLENIKTIDEAREAAGLLRDYQKELAGWRWEGGLVDDNDIAAELQNLEACLLSGDILEASGTMAYISGYLANKQKDIENAVNVREITETEEQEPETTPDLGFGDFLKELEKVVPEGEEPTLKAVKETAGVNFSEDGEKIITNLDDRLEELDALWQDGEVIASNIGVKLSAENQERIKKAVSGQLEDLQKLNGEMSLEIPVAEKAEVESLSLEHRAFLGIGDELKQIAEDVRNYLDAGNFVQALDAVRQYEGTFMGRIYFFSRLQGKTGSSQS